MAAADVTQPDLDEALSPRQNASPIDQAIRTIGNPLGSLDLRADPDAQATVTDFLDFTEYLPSDMMRSLTLIGKLDQTHQESSEKVNELTTLWGQLPSLPRAERVGPIELRAQISENLQHAVNARIYSHAEAVRMAENVNRHYNRASTILAKLETMLENYPTAEEMKSPVATSKSPQMSRAPKLALRVDGQKVRRPRVPRITVPGEVLAPYDLNYDAYSSGSESSSSSEEETEESHPTSRVTPGPYRIKIGKSSARPPKVGKVPKSRTSVPPPHYAGGVGISTSAALAQHKPPPENVVIGSADAPWGQLTPYELARLRKRMKKNAAWAPSDTMVARELSNLGRGIEAFKLAKKKAEEEGKVFEGKMPGPIMDPETGEARMPLGALTLEALATDEKNLSNRGMRLNEAKKAKRKALAELAAEEAEESLKSFKLLAQSLMSTPSSRPLQGQQAKKAVPASAAKPPKKRKRDSVPEAEVEKPKLLADAAAPAQRPQVKRTKTETRVPPPQINPSAPASQETAVPLPQRAAGAHIIHSTTPIPLPAHGHDHSITAKSGTSVASATSPAPSSNAGQPNPTQAPTAAPAPIKLAVTETPIPPPLHSPKKSTTPILPPVRETRKMQAARVQDKDGPKEPTQTTKAPSRAASLAPLSPNPDNDVQATAPGGGTSASGAARRPASRGKASSQEPHPSLAADRPRRASTARNTPAPERAEAAPARPPSSRRAKRPAPGIISRTVSGGNSAVGKRKAAPKKKSGRAGNKPKDSATSTDEMVSAGGEAFDVEVDDEGNVIDPNEARYCLCNRVSFGMMIQCDHDNCKYEWFHLECVGLQEIPARTTKWYCPECRILLNIGEKGEVSARGYKT
ncbi:hypothetical protein QBC34DRAFT_315227 [Podospora aff. communis PSN243]|uniref:PHD-type domain-containing protein n=1 Tax=Podospora aff. communis PSN243 TaxID=3040156 RepID=A0AAV9H920_9PEZI|nr:hypothetical protein QBC34DRAFT_315227 [Podospora aff. communis PSN243]